MLEFTDCVVACVVECADRALEVVDLVVEFAAWEPCVSAAGLLSAALSESDHMWL